METFDKISELSTCDCLSSSRKLIAFYCRNVFMEERIPFNEIPVAVMSICSRVLAGDG